MYVVFYVDITGVSPSEGSVNGGTMITIYGKYFDPNADSIEILVGGELHMYPHYANLFTHCMYRLT